MKNIGMVSVVMPAYNAEKYIGDAINSVLRQSYNNWELIIVEDCSTDKTMDIIKKFKDCRIKVFQNNKNRGIAYSTNFAIKQSIGEFIALLDDDDMYPEDRLQLSVNFMKKRQDVDIVGGCGLFINGNGDVIRNAVTPRNNPKLIKAMLLFQNWIVNGTVTIRKSFIEDNQLYYEDNCLGMQDFKFFIKASKVGTFSSMENVLLYSRQHGENETQRQKENNIQKRAELFAKFQRESLVLSGYNLKKNELEVINNLIKESGIRTYSISEIRELYDVLKEIIRQGRNMHIDYIEELEWQCKKLICDRLMRVENFFYESLD